MHGVNQRPKKIPNVDMDGIFAKSLPDNATIAVERNDTVIQISTYDYFEGRRKSAATRSGDNSNFAKSNMRKTENTLKMLDILAEIATVEHANGLKQDNIIRLLMKTNACLDELREAWKK